MHDPSSLLRLREELKDAKISSPVAWDKARCLPYLNACIKEALRLVPAIGIPFERVVPAGGMVVCDQYLKTRTVVGIRAGTVHRDPEAFGEDADVFNPQRWMEANSANLRAMDRAMFAMSLSQNLCGLMLMNEPVWSRNSILSREKHLVS
jgi:cytochrome P450